MESTILQNMDIFKGLETKIEDAIKCQACKKEVCWPLVVCFQGHGMCLQCKESRNECGVCKNPLLAKPPSLLNNLLQILPKRCKYYRNGCQNFEYVYENHQECCEFKNISCMLGKNGSCEWSGLIKDWYTHGLYDHNIHANFIEFWPSGTSSIIFQYYDFNSSWVTYNLGFKIKNEHFILYSEKHQDRELRTYITCLPTKDSSCDLTFRILFMKGYEPKQKLSLTITPLMNNNNVAMASIPLNLLYPLVDRSGNLKVHISPVKKKVTLVIRRHPV